jgi:hypothetical protein
VSRLPAGLGHNITISIPIGLIPISAPPRLRPAPALNHAQAPAPPWPTGAWMPVALADWYRAPRRAGGLLAIRCRRRGVKEGEVERVGPLAVRRWPPTIRRSTPAPAPPAAQSYPVPGPCHRHMSRPHEICGKISLNISQVYHHMYEQELGDLRPRPPRAPCPLPRRPHRPLLRPIRYPDPATDICQDCIEYLGRYSRTYLSYYIICLNMSGATCAV